MTHHPFSLLASLFSLAADLLERGLSLPDALAAIARAHDNIGPVMDAGRPIDRAAWYQQITAYHLGVPDLAAWESDHTREQTIDVLRGFARFRGARKYAITRSSN